VAQRKLVKCGTILSFHVSFLLVWFVVSLHFWEKKPQNQPMRREVGKEGEIKNNFDFSYSTVS
jgi:hypothetical protein